MFFLGARSKDVIAGVPVDALSSLQNQGDPRLAIAIGAVLNALLPGPTPSAAPGRPLPSADPVHRISGDVPPELRATLRDLTAAEQTGRLPRQGSGEDPIQTTAAPGRAGDVSSGRAASEKDPSAGFELRNPATGEYVPRPAKLSLRSAGFDLTEEAAKKRVDDLGSVPPLRSRDDLEGFYGWVDGMSADDIVLFRLRASKSERAALERRLRRASKFEAHPQAQTAAQVEKLEGRHEVITVASLPSLKRMGRRVRWMTSAENTQPTSVRLRDGRDPSPNAATFRHDEGSVPKSERDAMPQVERDRLQIAAETLGPMHDEDELLLFLVSKLPAEKRDRALAVAYQVFAERWYVEGVAGLPAGLRRMVREQGLDRPPPAMRPAGRADEVILDAYADDLAPFLKLKGEALRDSK